MYHCQYKNSKMTNTLKQKFVMIFCLIMLTTFVRSQSTVSSTGSSFTTNNFSSSGTNQVFGGPLPPTFTQSNAYTLPTNGSPTTTTSTTYLSSSSTGTQPSITPTNSIVTSSASTFTPTNYNTPLISTTNCLQIGGNGQCLTCRAGFMLNGQGTCIVVNTRQPSPVLPILIAPSSVTSIVDNGQLSTSQNIQQGQTSWSSFSPSPPNQFIPPTPTQQTATLDPNCYQFNGSQCVICSSRFYFGTNGICVLVNPQCQNYDNYTGACTSCYQGYIVSNGNCIIGQIGDANCQNYNSITQTCSQCYNGYYINQTTGICTKMNTLCNQSNAYTGACINCFPGYALNINTGTCQVTFTDPNCATSLPNNTCIACASRFYFNQQGICTIVNSLCKDYDLNNGACKTCYDGFVISGINCVQGIPTILPSQYSSPQYSTYSTYSSSPVPTFGPIPTPIQVPTPTPAPPAAATPSDVNCKTFSGYLCQQCYGGYYVTQTGTCQQLDPLCKTSSQITGSCTSCYQGYTLNGAKCVISQDTDSSSSNSSAGNIQSVVQGSSVVQIGTTDTNCLSYGNNTRCSQCRVGYYLQGTRNECRSVDTNCMSFNYQTSTCLSCMVGKRINGAICQ